MTNETGVIISPKEMYDMIQEVARSLQRIESRLDKLEEKMEGANLADERSREALNKADDALKLAQEVKDDQKWLWRIAIGALATGAITALFYFAQKGAGG